jgi:hypothetical protein
MCSARGVVTTSTCELLTAAFAKALASTRNWSNRPLTNQICPGSDTNLVN